jgi:hypothetical protein
MCILRGIGAIIRASRCQGTRHQPEGEPLVLSNPEQAKQNKADAMARAEAAPAPRALHRAGRTSTRVRHRRTNGGRWFPMQFHIARIVSA